METLEKIYQYNVFAIQNSDSGNPAIVIETSENDDKVLQEKARNLNAPVTVFINRIVNDAPIKIRFFYPNRETNICVHGALAAACHLLNIKDLSNKKNKLIEIVSKDNASFILSKYHDQYYINLKPSNISNKQFETSLPLSMVGLTEEDIDPKLPFEIYSVGSPKLLIPVKSLELLNNLKPQFENITRWSQENGVNGFYIYTRQTFNLVEKSNDIISFHARNFNPLSGQNEDIATGIAAAALAASYSKTYGKHQFIIEQGHILGSPCLIYITVNQQNEGDSIDNICVGGNVVESNPNLANKETSKIMKKFIVVPYDPNWPLIFENEFRLIRQTLDSNVLDVHHVGSTAVPGLLAKPRIDIICVVKKLMESIKPLESMGYQYRGEYNIPFHLGFSKRTPYEFNLHVFEENNSEIELNIMFRDYLRNHPEALNEYASLKKKLFSLASSFEKNQSMFTGYNLGKDDFIKRILKQTGFNKIRFHHCVHKEDIEAVKWIRKKYYFDKLEPFNPNAGLNEFKLSTSENLSPSDQVHFVLYLGVEIIGYAQIKLENSLQAEIQIFVIEEKHRSQGYGKYFLGLCERWLAMKNYQSILIKDLKRFPEIKDFFETRDYKKTGVSVFLKKLNDNKGHPAA